MSKFYFAEHRIKQLLIINKTLNYIKVLSFYNKHNLALLKKGLRYIFIQYILYIIIRSAVFKYEHL